MGKLFEAIVGGKNLKEDIEADYQAAQFRAESVVKSFMKDFSPKMTRMAFEKAFSKLCESTNLKEDTEDGDKYGFYTRDGDNETVYDKFGNYYQLDMWFIGEATPYKSYQEAVDDFRSGCLVDSGIDDDLRKEGVTDIEDYAKSFTDFAISICPNYLA